MFPIIIRRKAKNNRRKVFDSIVLRIKNDNINYYQIFFTSPTCITDLLSCHIDVTFLMHICEYKVDKGT